MKHFTTRRAFLGGMVAAMAAPSVCGAFAEAGLDFPLVDLHVHLDNSTIDAAAALGRERGVKFGIVEHAGTEENKYPVVLSSDKELEDYLAMLEGKGVYRGVQTEWTDWMKCFSKKTLVKLDYILTDAMTFPGKDGQRVKLWEPDAPERVDMSNREAFMDRLVEWTVRIMDEQPIDLLANVSWLPAPLAGDYDQFWTDKRIAKVIDTAVKHKVAIEISSSFKLPGMRFLKAAKAAGLKFSLGSNGRYPKMGQLEFSIERAKELGLKASDMFVPGVAGQKAAERREY